MKLYIIKNKKEIHPFAFTDKRVANLAAGTLFGYHYIEEVELPFIGRSVCYVEADFGISYDINNNRMRENIHTSSIYACVEHAKMDKLWVDTIKYMNTNPDQKYHIKDTPEEIFIASDHFGEPFNWGNYDGFNVGIRRIRVIKETW